MDEKSKNLLPVLGKREHLRMHYPIPVRFGGDAARLQDTLLKDIGAGGLRLLSREFVPVDSKVKLEFFLTPASEALLAVGKVVWIQKVPYSYQHEVGIQFLDISETSRKRIRSFVEQNFNKVQEIAPNQRDLYRDTSYTIAL